MRIRKSNKSQNRRVVGHVSELQRKYGNNKLKRKISEQDVLEK